MNQSPCFFSIDLLSALFLKLRLKYDIVPKKVQSTRIYLDLSGKYQMESRGRMMKRILRWEIAGVAVIIILGTTLHFWFEWTGYWRPMALIAAVNESTWEHFKMAFWPGFFFSLIEYRFIKDETNNFC